MATLIAADRVLDCLGGPALEGGAVLIEHGKILEVGRAAELAARAEVHLEFAGTLLPGLCDVHTHVNLSGSADCLERLMTESRTATVLRAVDNLHRQLAAGVTTIRDVGGKDGIDLELRDAINRGLVAGPRMFVAGEVICMTGGHACWVGLEVDGAVDACAAARRNLKRGVDHLKVIATGGVMTAGVEPGSPQLEEDEIRAVCREAHKAGRRVAAHAQGTEGIQNALRAGVDTIEHGFFIDSRTVEMFQETGAILVPTFAAARGIAGGRGRGVPDYMVDKMQAVGQAHVDSFRRCHTNRVPFAAGTDAGTPLNPHGSIAVELAAMVECGATAMEALLSATSGAARALGRSDMGTLERDRRADLLLVDGDPTKDITDIEKVLCVWKEGVVVAGSLLPRPAYAAAGATA